MIKRGWMLVFIVTVGCGDIVRFETPQPEGRRNVGLIPDKLLGTYLDVADSSMMTIFQDKVIRWGNHKFTYHFSQLDSADLAEITGNPVTKNEFGRPMIDNLTVVGDSIVQVTHFSDTIFSFSSNDILRKFKGHYFLNTRTDSSQWIVRKLTLTKNGVTLGFINTKDDLDKLRTLTNDVDTSFTFNPTRKQFKEFVKDDGFTVDVYVRIK